MLTVTVSSTIGNRMRKTQERKENQETTHKRLAYNMTCSHLLFPFYSYMKHYAHAILLAQDLGRSKDCQLR